MILRPWTGQNKPPLGVLPMMGHRLTPDYAWLFGEGGGPLVNESVGGRTGMFDGTYPPVWTLTGEGPAISFAGNTRAHIDISGITLAPPFTLAWRCKPAGTVSWKAILGSSSNNALWWLTGGQWQLYTNGLNAVTSVGTVPVDVPVSGAAVLPTTTSQQLFVNGLLSATDTDTWTGAWAPIYLGWDGGVGDNWNDWISWLYIYRRALTPTDVRDITAQPYCWLGTPDLAAMWAGIPAAGGHPGLRRLGIFDTGFGFDRSQQTRWG